MGVTRLTRFASTVEPIHGCSPAVSKADHHASLPGSTAVVAGHAELRVAGSAAAVAIGYTVGARLLLLDHLHARLRRGCVSNTGLRAADAVAGLELARRRHHPHVDHHRSRVHRLGLHRDRVLGVRLHRNGLSQQERLTITANRTICAIKAPVHGAARQFPVVVEAVEVAEAGVADNVRRGVG